MRKTVWITLMPAILTTIRRDIAILEMGSNHSGMDVVATQEVRAYGIGRISPSPRMAAIPQDPKATRVAKGEARRAPYHAPPPPPALPEWSVGQGDVAWPMPPTHVHSYAHIRPLVRLHVRWVVRASVTTFIRTRHHTYALQDRYLLRNFTKR